MNCEYNTNGEVAETASCSPPAAPAEGGGGDDHSELRTQPPPPPPPPPLVQGDCSIIGVGVSISEVHHPAVPTLSLLLSALSLLLSPSSVPHQDSKDGDTAHEPEPWKAGEGAAGRPSSPRVKSWHVAVPALLFYDIIRFVIVAKNMPMSQPPYKL